MAHPPSPRRKRSKRSRPRKQVAKAKKKIAPRVIGFGEGGYGRGEYGGSISSGPIAALQGTGGLSATADVLPPPISIFPTVYPQEPSGTITVQNYITINVHSADFHTLENTMGQLLAEMRKSNAIAGEVRDKLIAELNAGMTILKSPKPTRGLIDLLLGAAPQVHRRESGRSNDWGIGRRRADGAAEDDGPRLKRHHDHAGG